MSTINRGVRTATRNFRPVLQSRLRAPLAATTRAKFGAAARTPSFKQFSTMSPLQSGAPPPPQAREYDPEIKDIASYVHHTPIDSDLAVSFAARIYQNTTNFMPVRYRSICFPRHSWLRSRRSTVQGMHKTSWPNCRGNRCSQWHKNPRYSLSNLTLSMAHSTLVL